MRRNLVSLHGNFLAVTASMMLAGAAGCASHSAPPPSAVVPTNVMAASDNSLRGLDAANGQSMADAASSKAPSVTDKTLTSGAKSRGFDFGGGGGGGGGPITMDQLGQMLTSLGAQPQVVNGLYSVHVQEQSPPNLSYNIITGISPNQKVVIFYIPLLPVDPQGWANQQSLLNVLAANLDMLPASFSIAGKMIGIQFGISNMAVTPDVLKQAISFQIDVLHSTQPLWSQWQQGGGGGTAPGGGSPAPAPAPAPSGNPFG